MDHKCKCGYGPGCNEMDTIEFVFEGVLSSIVGLIGFLGNVSAILYYRKRRSNVKTTFHGLMMALAAYDLVIIISALLLFSIPRFSCNFEETHFYQTYTPWIFFINHVGLEGSIYLTIAITVERYFVICQPMFYRSKLWPTKCFVIPITCFSVIYCIPKLFELEPKVHYKISHLSNFTMDTELIQQCLLPLAYKQMTDQQLLRGSTGSSYAACTMWFGQRYDEPKQLIDTPSSCKEFNIEGLLDKILTKSTLSTLIPTQLRQNPCYYQVYIVWLNIIFNVVIPFLVLIILNAYILHYLILNERRGSGKGREESVKSKRGIYGRQVSFNRESSKLRIHHHPSQMRKRENKVALAKVSLAIVFIFVICHSIKWIPNFYEFYWVRFDKLRTIRYYLRAKKK